MAPARASESDVVAGRGSGSRFPAPHLTVQGVGECKCLSVYISAPRNRNALPMTDTELRLMAAAAMRGLSKMPKTG